MKLKKIFKIIIYIFAFIGFVLVGGYLAVRFGFTNTRGIIDTQNEKFLNPEKISEQKIFPWNQGEEWGVFKDAVTRDTAVLKRVENETGISSRLIVSILGVEQLRLFYSERESFKQFFAPLKILGVQSQFSWGIMGIKEATAKQIENNLKDASSQFYLGKENENLLDFETNDHDAERFARLTDDHDRYYQYLYSAIYLKQIINQWRNAGFDISRKPEILATLYNIGFENSKPNAEPQAGGSEIDIGNNKYSFGGLAFEIYYSGELTEYFGKNF